MWVRMLLKKIKEEELFVKGTDSFLGEVYKAQKDYNWILIAEGEVDFADYNPVEEIEAPTSDNSNAESKDSLIGTVHKYTNYAGHSIWYEVTSENTVEVIKCETYKKTIAIPDTYNINGLEYKVTSIGEKAFENCASIKRVTIGANVKAIGKKAFHGCKNINKITFTTKKLKKGSVGNKAFKGIKKNAKITVPKGKKKKYTTILRDGGVSKKASIEATYTKPVMFIINKKYETIYYTKTGKNTVEFTKCYTDKRNVVVPKKITVDGKTYKVTSIGANAIKNNRVIQKVTISKNVKKIGKKAFYGCKNLKTIIIKSKKLKAKNIGSKAFEGISKVATIEIPK